MALTRTSIAIIVIVGLVVLAAIIAPIAYFASRESDDEVDRSGRLDCFPEMRSPAVTLTRETCESRGCVFDEEAASDSSLGVACYYTSSAGSVRYSVSHTRKEDLDKTTKHFLTVHGRPPFPNHFFQPVMTVHHLTEQLIRITFDDEYASPARYRVPLELNLPRHPGDNITKVLYEFEVTDTDNTSFVVRRKDTGTIIVDARVGGLVLTEQFLQLALRLPSANLYGLGEHSRHSFRRKFDATNAWPAFARDQPPGGNTNLYGVHPFYTCVEDERGNAHGVFLLNSNAQEYEFSPGPVLTWRTSGGVLDFFVFMGPTPEMVVQQYTELIGRPVMPPYWSLGFQLSRYGYNTLDNLRRAVEDTRNNNIPLDIQYADIDHMDERKDFTVDEVNFAGLNAYFQSLRSQGMRTIIILDPCIISNETDYEPYEELKKVEGNIQWPAGFTPWNGTFDTDNSVLGFVWPKGKVVFPDFFKNGTREVWKELIVKHHQKLVFDGLWIDMNEPANFGTNEERPWNWPEDARPYSSLICRENRWDDPAYRPLAAYLYDTEEKRVRLSDKTLCMNTVQGDDNQYRHYDVHSLYGWSQTPITLEAARAATGGRSIVISRSTFPGSGKYAGHWLGDNTSIWPHLPDSIIGMLDFNLFGIPYIGADICGFFGNATEELCLRWMQLGAFYPFSRNHNSKDSVEQHPSVFGQRVVDASREILQTRYWLLPYLYTLFHQAHTEGSTVVRPLHHEFPADPTALGIVRQFLWGPALLISPILEKDASELKYYLPKGRWYHFYTGELSIGPANKSVTVTMTSKPDLHLRGGHIIVMQQPDKNTHFSRQKPFRVRAMLDKPDSEGGTASGTFFWDDGVSVDTFENGRYFLANYRISNRTLQVTVAHTSAVLPEVNTLNYESVIVHGVTSAKRVTVTTSSGTDIQNQFNLDEKLTVQLKAAVPLKTAFTMSWE